MADILLIRPARSSSVSAAWPASRPSLHPSCDLGRRLSVPVRRSRHRTPDSGVAWWGGRGGRAPIRWWPCVRTLAGVESAAARPSRRAVAARFEGARPLIGRLGAPLFTAPRLNRARRQRRSARRIFSGGDRRERSNQSGAAGQITSPNRDWRFCSVATRSARLVTAP